jgi:hypothetical protein
VTRHFFIAVVAWSPDYVHTAVTYEVPAILASLKHAGLGRDDATFLLWTDMPDAFESALAGWQVVHRTVALPRGGELRQAQAQPRTRAEVIARLRAHPAAQAAHAGQALAPSPQRDPLPREYWAAFMQAHRDAIAATPAGQICCLFNADIVPSIETFAVVREALAGDKRVAISVGIRTLLDGNEPPIGADAETLARYIWTHPHPITSDCVWGSGHSRHPTILFFVHDGGAVSMHCFHQTPMFIVKDRPLPIKGTIDDDLLAHYREEELVYLADRACCFAELSRAWKRHPSGAPLNVDDVLDFGRRRFSPAHKRNFRHRFRVLGEPAANHPGAEAIIARLG